MAIPDEIIAKMLAGHVDRMGNIAKTAVDTQQALSKRLTDCIRDPTEIHADVADILLNKPEADIPADESEVKDGEPS